METCEKLAVKLIDIRRIRLAYLMFCLPRNTRMHPKGKTVNIAIHLWRSAAAGIQTKLLTETVIIIHSEKEAFVVKNTGNIKKDLQKSSEVATLDGTLGNKARPESSVVFMYH